MNTISPKEQEIQELRERLRQLEAELKDKPAPSGRPAATTRPITPRPASCWGAWRP